MEGKVEVLSEEELKAAIAHELGHLARYDGLWNVLTGVVVAVFFFQPLNAVALRRLKEAREEAADEWALRLTRSPLALARCLARVGAMVLPDRVKPLLITTLVGPESSLVRRVQLILVRRDSRPGKALAQSAALLALFCCVTALAPALAGPQTMAPEAPTRTLSEHASAPVAGKVDASVATLPQAQPGSEMKPVGSQRSRRLARMLSDSDPTLRRHAVDEIGREERWSDVPEVFHMALDPDSMVRWQLSTVIGLTEPEEGIPTLAMLLSDSTALVRYSAAWALSGFELVQLESSEALEALIENSGDASSRVRRQVAATLAILEPASGIPALLELVDDENRTATCVGENAPRRLAAGSPSAVDRRRSRGSVESLLCARPDPAFQPLGSHQETLMGRRFGFLFIAVALLAPSAGCGQPASAGPAPPDFEEVGEFWYLPIDRGIELFVHEIGEGNGPPVVVLHGGPGADHSYLHQVASGLTDRLHFVFYDQRGSLRSRATDAEYTIDRHVEDLEKLRAALNAERIQLLAHSAGTTLAYHYLAAHPDRVANVVLVGAVHPVNGAPGAEIYDDEDRALFAERSKLQEAFNDRPALQEAARRAGLKDASSPRQRARLAVLRQFAADVYHLDRWEHHVPLRINPEVAQQTQQSIDWNYDRTDLLAAHPFPITVINGEFDYVIGPRGSPIWRKLAREHMPNVDVVSVPNAGHSAWIDDPAFFREKLVEALQH